MVHLHYCASPHAREPRRARSQPLDAPGPRALAVDPNRRSTAQLPVHTVVAEHESRTVEHSFELVLQHPANLVHLSKSRGCRQRRWLCWGYSPMARASVAGGDVVARDQMGLLP